MTEMESHEAGYPPFRHSLENPLGTLTFHTTAAKLAGVRLLLTPAPSPHDSRPPRGIHSSHRSRAFHKLPGPSNPISQSYPHNKSPTPSV